MDAAMKKAAPESNYRAFVEWNDIPRKKAKWGGILLDILLLAVIAVGCVGSAEALYLNSNYNDAFYINGMSMYPTLNADARRSENGVTRKLTWRDGSNVRGDIVDYGLGKTGDFQNWKAGLKRNDIVMVYYAKDFDVSSTGEYVLKPGRDPKIKRIVGLPNETITFAVSSVTTEEENPAWGKTTIITEAGETKVLPPLYTMDDFPDVNGVSYVPAGLPDLEAKEKTWVLGEDEYFVMGDNRGGVRCQYSSDSRENGPVKKDWIFGKAFLITSQRTLNIDNQGKYSVEFRISDLRFPWDFKRLD